MVNNMLVYITKGGILENQLAVFWPCAALTLLIRILLPRALKAEKDGVRFALGVGVFVSYTLLLMVVIYHLCYFAVSVEDCLIRACVAVAMINIIMLFLAAILFFTRDKRPMTEEERIKLKDM